ncbi:hypothetical protein AVEN_269483-1 [Araneus ventricosus]|uniref:Endonuclease/exonuclease/phosphatase domain-containing protein n=1 Tax=Araneus ventricosus TaxID=182803 RepID=A0A4Y2TPV9_ARAVE|nr:hypothetical protein AVEN_269483-1 [Araneus ventricosus]
MGILRKQTRLRLKALMEMALNSEKALNALIATSGLNQAKQDKLRSAVGDLSRVCWQQQVLISHVCGTLSDKESSRKETKDKVLYSQAVAKRSDRDRSRSRPKKQFNVIIYPKRDQNSDNTKKDTQSKISPSKISVRVNSVKNIKKGILINTPFEEDIDKKKIVILGDFNAKSSIWGPRNTDKRGNIVHDLINQFDLVVINDRDYLPSFIGPCGISWIDIMMVKNIGVDRITEWKIPDRITLSDHQIMEFKMDFIMDYGVW